MAGYIVYWPKDQMEKLGKEKDTGPIKVVFGSAHSRMPTIKSIKVGDIVFPVSLKDNNFYVIARLPVEIVEPAYQYLIRELGNRCSALIPDDMNRDDYYDTPLNTHQCHQRPFNCCSQTAVHGSKGSTIEYRQIPAEFIPEMRFGTTKSKQRPLLLAKSGSPMVNTLVSTRKMSDETLTLFESFFK